MKQHIFTTYTCVILFLVLGCQACGKEKNSTIVEGKVIDAKTGIGLEGVKVEFSMHPEDDVDFHQAVEQQTSTNNDGLFFIELLPGTEFAGSFTFLKDSFNILIIWDYTIKKHEKNNISFDLWRQDSWLKLIMRNNLPENDSLFIALRNKTVYPQIFSGNIQDFPLVVPFGEERMEYFSFSSDTYTSIRHETSLYVYQQNPIVDSVYMTANDTIERIISY